MKVVSSKCPGCGSPTALPDDGRAIPCLSCGLPSALMPDHTVRLVMQRDPKEVDARLQLAREAYKADNVEEAYAYCNKVLELDIKNPEAWLLKGLSQAWRGSLNSSNFSELLNCFKNCVENGGADLAAGFGHTQVVILARNRRNAWTQHYMRYQRGVVNQDGSLTRERDAAVIEMVTVLHGILALQPSVALTECIYEIADHPTSDPLRKKYLTEVRAALLPWLEKHSDEFRSNQPRITPRRKGQVRIHYGSDLGVSPWLIAAGIAAFGVLLWIALAGPNQ